MRNAIKGASAFVLAIVSFQLQGVTAMVSAEDVIKKFDLTPLPEEGGFYRETFKSGTYVQSQKGNEVSLQRAASTAIYYLVTPDDYSALHRVLSDEVFHFYAGDPAEMIQINDQGQLTKIILGSDFMNGQQPQVVVTRGTWQALKLREGGQWALLGTTVAPGFEFADFEIGRREQLLKEFPQFREEILRHTRE